MGSFGCLPTELLDPILEQLDRPALSRLSRTCRSFYAIVVLRVFEHIAIDDTSRSADSAYVGAQRHGAVTRSLSLDITYNECTIIGCCIANGDLTRCPFLAANFGMGLPPGAEALLSGKFLPRLEEVEVRFRITDKHPTLYYRAHPSYMGPDWKFPDMVDAARAVITSLCRNNTIKTLALMNYPPFDPLEFLHTPEDTASWTGLLGRLHDFSLSMFRHAIDYIPGDVHDANFQYRMPAAFFDHLGSVRRLTVSYSTEEFLVLEPTDLPSVHLRRDCMPYLEELEIGNAMLTSELTKCLVNMAKRPLRLTLRGNAARDSAPHALGITWKELFDQLVRRRALIHDFSLESSGGVSRRAGPDGLTTQGSTAPLEKGAREPERMLFQYAATSIPDCMPRNRRYNDVDETAKQFEKGEDEEAYRRFIGLIKANHDKVQGRVQGRPS
ncbi:hypothetical protein RB595_001789 [Gaeumannomyces hyphopodioides]